MPMRSIGLTKGLVIALLMGIALPALAAEPPQLAQAGSGQAASRDDILDQIVRRMALCAEVANAARRAECYDRIQSSPEGVAARGHGAGQAPQSPPAYVAVPGTSEPRIEVNYPHKECYENRINCAYDTQASRPGAGLLPAGAIRELGRTQGPLPAKGVLQPLVMVRIDGLRDQQEKWVLTVAASSAALVPIDPSFACTLTNGGQPVTEMTYTANAVRPGESVSIEMTGPAVTASYVDGANCRVIGPIVLK